MWLIDSKQGILTSCRIASTEIIEDSFQSIELLLKKDTIEDGKKILKDEIKKRGLDEKKFLDPETYKTYLGAFGARSLDDILYFIGKKTLSVATLLEKVNPKMKETVEAAEIKEEGVDGCIIEGPISYDLAMDPASAPIKGYVSPVAGDADLLVVPDIVSGNIAAKTITVIGGGRTGGVVLGAKVPVLLVSRAASADDKYMSIVIAALVGGK